jgi:hypothetical protein
MALAMQLKRRGGAPYRIDMSALTPDPTKTWRYRLGMFGVEAVGAIIFVTIVVGTVMLVAPLGPKFGDFIDWLAVVS